MGASCCTTSGHEILSAGVGSELIGLGRSLYAVFERSLIAHALDQVGRRLQAGETSPATEFVTTTPAGRLLRVPGTGDRASGGRWRDGDVSMTGYVPSRRHHTDLREGKQARCADPVADRRRPRALGNIRAAAEMLNNYPDMEAEQRARFLSVIRNEVEGLSGRVEQASKAYARELSARWKLEEMRGADLVAFAVARVSARCGLPVRRGHRRRGLDEGRELSFLQVLCYLTARLRDEYEVSEVRLSLSSDGEHACLDLGWLGTAINSETVMNWEIEPMRSAGEDSPLSVRDVLDRGNGEMVPAQTGIAPGCLPLPAAAGAAAGTDGGGVRGRARQSAGYYDFDLFSWSEKSHTLDDRLLSELDYTVFDTETTGLEPSNGDEIIQIGATRIVNRRLLTHEVFDQLIDPCRHLPEASVKIHGITPEMLVDQPPIGKVLPQFRAFCADTVLVAHNAAFDMRFCS